MRRDIKKFTKKSSADFQKNSKLLSIQSNLFDIIGNFSFITRFFCER